MDSRKKIFYIDLMNLQAYHVLRLADDVLVKQLNQEKFTSYH